MNTIIDAHVVDEPDGAIDVDVPAGWQVVEPPPGVALLALEPDEHAAFRSNLVVTLQRRTDSIGTPSATEVDAYLTTLIDSLDARLIDVEVLDVWTSGPNPDAPERLATQRVLIAYRIDAAGHDAPLEVEMMQQHVWLHDEIVTLTASVPATVDQTTIDTLDACLESLVLAP